MERLWIAAPALALGVFFQTGCSGKTATNSGGTGETSAPVCTGKAGAYRGKTNQSLSAAGLDRTFILYAPPTLDPNRGVPVVFVFHGAGMTGEDMFDFTGYTDIADREGFVAVFPDGENGARSLTPWNVGQGACTPGGFASATGDDSAFLDAMLGFVEDDQCLDHDHVFATGFSMGGYFSNEIGCTRPDFRGVGPGSGGTHDLAACATEHKPVIIFHGTSDPVIPVTCGSEARDRWAAKNGCSTDVASMDVMGGHCEYSQGCAADGQVALCLFDGMGHAWAGGISGSIFSDATRASASELGWAFFKAYAW